MLQVPQIHGAIEKVGKKFVIFHFQNMLSQGHNRPEGQIGVKESVNIRRTANVPIKGDADVSRGIYKRCPLIGNDDFWPQKILRILGVEFPEQAAGWAGKDKLTV